MKVNPTIAALGLVATMVLPATAQDMSYDAAIADVEQTLGMIPEFVELHPRAGLAGAWLQLKELGFGESTALPVETKALIELAVAAQIPCEYCTWAAIRGARSAGATEEQIREAVAMAATVRYWSTILNGLEANLDTFKAQFGPLVGEGGE